MQIFIYVIVSKINIKLKIYETLSIFYNSHLTTYFNILKINYFAFKKYIKTSYVPSLNLYNGLYALFLMCLHYFLT